MPDARITLSLTEISSDLLLTMGNRGYLKWSKDLAEGIRSCLVGIDGQQLQFDIHTEPLRPASTKGDEAVLLIGAIAVTIANYPGLSAEAKRLAEAVWGVLKKALRGKSTSASIEVHDATSTSPQVTKNERKVKIVAEDVEGVLALLAALESSGRHSRHVTITPRKE